ncbi:cytochrome P450 [Fomes fomentarius]|nr:cytochrome P450 [Fomes fomentarius]
MPKVEPWVAYRDLCLKYGDVLHFRVLGHSTVVLGSARIIKEYLNKRSANTSDRKQTPLIKLTGGELNFGHLPYGQSWKRHRTAFTQHFNRAAVSQYLPYIRTTAHKLLADILREPSRIQDHLAFNFSATLLKLLYGIDVTDERDKYIKTVNWALAGTPGGRGVPGKFLIRFFPLLRHLPSFFPGAGFQRQFLQWQAAASALKNVPFSYIKEVMAQSISRRCVIRTLLEKMTSTPGKDSLSVEETEDLVKNVGAISFDAGADTTLSTIQATLLALSLQPDILRKVQGELDDVVGPNRLPEFSDRKSLVYLDAVIKETLRWHNVVPLGVPHCTTADDELDGCFIPKNTVLLPNIWACMHDPEAYSNPDQYRPERFLKNGKPDETVRNPLDYVFGFGRSRICPGQYYAEAVLFINIASILHVFDVSSPQARNGPPVINEMRASDGYLLYPEPCRFIVKPRSAAIEALILAQES